MPKRGGGAGAIGIAVLAIAAGLAVVAFTRKEPQVPDGEPPAPPGDGVNGTGPAAFKPVLLGDAKVEVNPF